MKLIMLVLGLVLVFGGLIADNPLLASILVIAGSIILGILLGDLIFWGFE